MIAWNTLSFFALKDFVTEYKNLFSMFNSIDVKEWISGFFLINLIFFHLSCLKEFKYLLELKEYLFYFDGQSNLLNGQSLWTEHINTKLSFILFLEV